MRYSFLLATAILFLSACNKDKYTTAPQISYKGISPNAVNLSLTNQVAPVITLEVTDAEGDLGFRGSDTAKIFIMNLLTGKIDSSLRFPDISAVAKKNFKGDLEISVDTNILLEGTNRPRPKTDTLYYEIYIKDFAKNKSNVIRTTDPVFVIAP
jgi:hypothetical protein